MRLDVTHDTVQPGYFAITSDVMANGKSIRKIAPMDTIDARSLGTPCRYARARLAHGTATQSARLVDGCRHVSAASELRRNREVASKSRDGGSLADTLELPLRDRNALLVVAGFAPIYRESQLTTPEMAPVRQAIEFILRHQEPYPAIVMNRYWDVLMLNEAANRIFGTLKPGGPKHGNVMHQVFDPTDMRGVVGNWNEIAADLIRHLHDEAAAAPTDARLQQLLKEVLAYPDVPTQWRTRQLGTAPLPMMTTVLRNEQLELRFLSTLTTFGTTRDITIDELRIESMFPVDEATAEFCRQGCDYNLRAGIVRWPRGGCTSMPVTRPLESTSNVACSGSSVAKNSRSFSACSRSFGRPQLAGSSIVKQRALPADDDDAFVLHVVAADVAVENRRVERDLRATRTLRLSQRHARLQQMARNVARTRRLIRQHDYTDASLRLPGQRAREPEAAAVVE